MHDDISSAWILYRRHLFDSLNFRALALPLGEIVQYRNVMCQHICLGTLRVNLQSFQKHY